MSKLLQLTKNSWILKSKTGNSGLLFFDEEKYIFMSIDSRKEFSTLEDVSKKFGKLEFEERVVEEEENTSVHGYPVKHLGINVVSEEPPRYTLGNNKTIYVAGYWGIKYANGWTPSFCPKEVTVKNYESVGPFKNKLEMLNHISNLTMAENMKQ